MKEVTLSFRVSVRMEKKILISDEQYRALMDYEDGLFEIEKEHCMPYDNYIRESIYVNDIGY